MTSQTAPVPAERARVPSAARGLIRGLVYTAIALGIWLAIVPSNQWVEQFANAMTLGALYALVALGYTMVYGIIELINFAHGDVFMVGSFVSLWFLADFLKIQGPIYDVPLLIVVLIAVFTFSMVVMGIVGIVINRIAYQPLRNAPRLAPLITAIGVSFILQNIIQFVFGPFTITSPQIFPVDWTVTIFGAEVGLINFFIVGVAFVLMVALQLFVGRTRLGRAMRSTAQDREAAALMGVNINRTIAITFLIGSALAGAAGVVQGLYYGATNFQLGFFAGLKAFTAAVLGGIGNTLGAALGGFIIGFIEVGAQASGYGRWGPAIVFTVLVVVLVFRPSGLLGQQLGERA
jgi:branched-chain amino acid transport system permease protein